MLFGVMDQRVSPLKSGNNPPLPRSKRVLLTVVDKPGVSRNGRGAVEDYLCYAGERWGQRQGQGIFNRACTHANRNAMCHLLGPVSC